MKKFVVSFVIARNITAQAGNRSIYVRITKPNNEVLTNGGTFVYENRNLEYSAKKDIEYNGEATSVTVYWDVNEFLSKGTYRVSVFAMGIISETQASTMRSRNVEECAICTKIG